MSGKVYLKGEEYRHKRIIFVESAPESERVRERDCYLCSQSPSAGSKKASRYTRGHEPEHVIKRGEGQLQNTGTTEPDPISITFNGLERGAVM